MYGLKDVWNRISEYSTVLYVYIYMYRMFFQRDLVLYGQKRLAQEPSDF